MSTNTSNITVNELVVFKNQIFEAIKLITACTPFLIIALGILGNPLTLYCVVSDNSLRKMSSMVILMFVTVSDTLSLFTWNVNHFYKYYYKINYYYLNIYLCRIMTFVQYFGLQSSGFLLSLLTIDRFITVASTPGSFYSKLPFSTPKSAYIWSSSIITVVFLLNFHILILNGYSDPLVYVNKTMIKELNGSMFTYNENTLIKSKKRSNVYNCNKYQTGFNLYPEWDRANMILYNLVPFFLMITFNSLLIHKALGSSKTSNHDENSRKANHKKFKITFSLLLISFTFLVFTLPSGIYFGFIKNNLQNQLGNFFGSILDFFGFLNHSILFFILYFSNYKFQQVVIFKFKKLFKMKNLNYFADLSKTNH